ncbi:hypothetical protein EON63_19890 [archaeon]|nr:MAG: hypothetical protein EON63_19890 [archaeon]
MMYWCICCVLLCVCYVYVYCATVCICIGSDMDGNVIYVRVELKCTVCSHLLLMCMLRSSMCM